jgi:hypothetical protein
LAGRYGDKSNPYAIIAEYQKQTFNVAPVLEDVLAYMSDAGFGLVEYRHPKQLNDSDPEDGQTFFANEFAIWDFMVFKKIEAC